MEEKADRHHRPRTTKQVAERAKAVVAEAFGCEPDHFHDAVSVVVGYLEIEAGDYPQCPYCGSSLKKHDEIRFKCKNRDCHGTPYIGWTTAIGIDASTEDIDVSTPLSDPGTTSAHRRRQDQFGQSDYPF